MYSFFGWHQLINDKNIPSPLWKKIFDDIWKCLNCGNKKVPVEISPEYSILTSSTPKEREIYCSKCGERMSHLENRSYGLSPQVLRKQQMKSVSHPVWGRKMPLWSISKDV